MLSKTRSCEQSFIEAPARAPFVCLARVSVFGALLLTARSHNAFTASVYRQRLAGDHGAVRIPA